MKVLQIEQLDGQLILSRFEGLLHKIECLERNFQPKEPTVYLTRKEVATLFSVSLVTIHDWTQKGILQAYRIANRIFYKRHEIESALQQVKSSR